MHTSRGGSMVRNIYSAKSRRVSKKCSDKTCLRRRRSVCSHTTQLSAISTKPIVKSVIKVPFRKSQNVVVIKHQGIQKNAQISTKASEGLHRQILKRKILNLSNLLTLTRSFFVSFINVSETATVSRIRYECVRAVKQRQRAQDKGCHCSVQLPPPSTYYYNKRKISLHAGQ